MSKERISELRNALSKLERRMQPLEWDLTRNQINEFQKRKLENYKKEHSTLASELHDLSN